MLSKTMLGDLAVFWLYVSLICSFLHYITLQSREPSQKLNSRHFDADKVNKITNVHRRFKHKISQNNLKHAD